MGLCLVAAFAMSACAAATASASPDLTLAWGDNTSGELGNGTTTGSDVPVPVSGLSRVKAISAGDGSSLALLTNGTVMAWGYNGSGALGDGTTTGSDVPVPVNGLSGVKAISASGRVSLALLRNGTVMAWGDNRMGELGNGTTGPEACEYGTSCSRTPVPVNGLSGVKAISAGWEFSLALLRNGTVMAWGGNDSGELGTGTTGPEVCEFHLSRPGETYHEACSRTPVPVSGLSGVKAISARGRGMALLKNGTVMAWGSNSSPGELGTGTIGPEVCEFGVPCSRTPVPVSGLSGVKAISGGLEFSLALLRNGTVMAWGENYWGQLGSGVGRSSDVPVPVSGLSGVTAISAGGDSSLALLHNGTVMAWGYNGSGALGNGTTTGSDVPVPVSWLSGVKAISAGGEFSLAVRRRGSYPGTLLPLGLAAPSP